MSEIEYIRPNEDIWTLVERGILPEWIARDAEPHGMDEAEYILNEFDWEWGWDLGDGYTSEQWKVLEEVRKRISAGIENYYANKELVAKDREERDRREARRKKREVVKKKFANNYLDRDDVEWVIDYEEQYGDFPYLHFVCFRTFLPSRKDVQKAQLLSIGVTVDYPMETAEIKSLFPDLTKKQLADLRYKTWTLAQSYKEYVDRVLGGLPEELPDTDSAFWSDLIESQRLDKFNLTPPRLRRLMQFFRLNELAPAKRKQLSLGFY